MAIMLTFCIVLYCVLFLLYGGGMFCWAKAREVKGVYPIRQLKLADKEAQALLEL